MSQRRPSLRRTRSLRPHALFDMRADGASPAADTGGRNADPDRASAGRTAQGGGTHGGTGIPRVRSAADGGRRAEGGRRKSDGGRAACVETRTYPSDAGRPPGTWRATRREIEEDLATRDARPETMSRHGGTTSTRSVVDRGVDPQMATPAGTLLAGGVLSTVNQRTGGA